MPRQGVRSNVYQPPRLDFNGKMVWRVPKTRTRCFLFSGETGTGDCFHRRNRLVPPRTPILGPRSHVDDESRVRSPPSLLLPLFPSPTNLPLFFTDGWPSGTASQQATTNVSSSSAPPTVPTTLTPPSSAACPNGTPSPFPTLLVGEKYWSCYSEGFRLMRVWIWRC